MCCKNPLQQIVNLLVVFQASFSPAKLQENMSAKWPVSASALMGFTVRDFCSTLRTGQRFARHSPAALGLHTSKKCLSLI